MSSTPQPAFERHYRLGELADLWKLGRETIRLLVKDEQGVIKVRLGRKQAHTTLFGTGIRSHQDSYTATERWTEALSALDSRYAAEPRTLYGRINTSAEIPSPSCNLRIISIVSALRRFRTSATRARLPR